MQFRFDLEVGLFLLLNAVGTIVPLGRDLEEEPPFAGVVLLCLRYNEFILLTDGTVIFLVAFETVLTPLTGVLGDWLTLSEEEVLFGRPTVLLTEPVRLFAFDFLELCAFTFLEPPCSLLGCALGDFAATLGIFAGGGEGESSAGRP